MDSNNDIENCCICMGDLEKYDIGLNETCGHIFCYQCVTEYLKIQKQCPLCKKEMTKKTIYRIENNTCCNENLTEMAKLINEVGTKMANLIHYIKNNENEHIIIFSQWDDFLEKINNILSKHGIRNVYCYGNIWQKQKAINTFNSDNDCNIILLSSSTVASGINLTKAKQVILLDPVYGNYEYRKSTEWQAIGRTYRIGQTSSVKVVRFVINNTIEEEIYNMNISEEQNIQTSNRKFIQKTENVHVDIENY